MHLTPTYSDPSHIDSGPSPVKYPHSAILLIGPLPPPVGGQSVLNQAILESTVSDTYPLRAMNVGVRDVNIISRLLITGGYCSELFSLLIKHRDIALFHIHTQATLGFFEKSLLVLLCKLFRRKTLLHIHGGRFRNFWQNATWYKKFLIKWLLERNNALIVLSSSWKKFYEEEIACRIPIKILPNAVKIQKSILLFNNSNQIRFLYAGHLKPEKGLLDLLEAFKIVIADSKNTLSLTLMGKGDTAENERIIRHAYSNSELAQVELLGALEGTDKWNAFETANVFILPSHSEDMPLSILEAMAMGKPIIATTVGLISEVVEHGVNGLLVPPQSPTALAEAMRTLIDNPELCRAMSNANQQKVERSYSFAKLEERLVEIYGQVLGTKTS